VEKTARDLVDQVQLDLARGVVHRARTTRSEPLREAEQAGIYAAEDLQLDRRRFQAPGVASVRSSARRAGESRAS
jgi:hypothetical protein